MVMYCICNGDVFLLSLLFSQYGLNVVHAKDIEFICMIIVRIKNCFNDFSSLVIDEGRLQSP